MLTWPLVDYRILNRETVTTTDVDVVYSAANDRTVGIKKKVH